MEESQNKLKIKSKINDLLLQIKKELYQIIEYIQINLIHLQNKDLDFDEKEIKNKTKVKLGVKIKRLRNLIDNDDSKEKNGINLNENEEKKENEKIILKNKKLKAKIKKFKKYTIGIIKKVKDILLKINDDEKKNSGEFMSERVQELNYDNGRYRGKVIMD